jgi:hypothetical protein
MFLYRYFPSLVLFSPKYTSIDTFAISGTFFGPAERANKSVAVMAQAEIVDRWQFRRRSHIYSTMAVRFTAISLRIYLF